MHRDRHTVDDPALRIYLDKVFGADFPARYAGGLILGLCLGLA
jgi:hypothetical protein